MRGTLKVRNVGAVVRAIEARSPRGRARASAEATYTAPYALWVHENLDARHRVGQAKFLTTAARLAAPRMRETARLAIANRDGVLVAAVRAARVLLAASRPLVPVDTGALRESGTVRVTS